MHEIILLGFPREASHAVPSAQLVRRGMKTCGEVSCGVEGAAGVAGI